MMKMTRMHFQIMLYMNPRAPKTMIRPKNAFVAKYWRTIALFLLFGIVWFVGLGYRPLFKTDEGRYAEIPREMLVSGNWVTPRLNGFRYFEKPPLQYWITAGAYRIFGVHQWCARLWTAIASFLTIVLTMFAAFKLHGIRSGIIAGSVLAGSFYFGLFGHVNTLDAGLTFALTLTIFGLALGLRAPSESRQERGWMLVAYAGAALAVLSKGLIGVLLPGATMALYLLIKRDRALLRRVHLASGITLFLAMTLPWFVAVSLQNRDFLWQFFVVQEFMRFLTPISNRPGSWWYFLPILLLAMLPWIGATARALTRGARNLTRRRGFDAEALLWLWVVFVFAFFSISHSKLPTYILPIVPALAVLVGTMISGQERVPSSAGWLSILCAVVMLVVGIVGPHLTRHTDSAVSHVMAEWILAGGVVLLAAGVSALLLQKHSTATVVMVCAAWLIVTRLVMFGAATLAPNFSTRKLAQAAAPYDRPDVPVYSVGEYQQTLPFYLRRTMTLVAYQGELGFGIQHARHSLEERYIPTLQDFARTWRGRKKGLAFALRKTMPALRKLGMHYRVVASNPRWVAFVPKARP